MVFLLNHTNILVFTNSRYSVLIVCNVTVIKVIKTFQVLFCVIEIKT